MNSPEGNQWYWNEGKTVFVKLHSLFIQLLISLNFDLTEKSAVKYFSDWRPVQMGWFTSSYCSCRSCIG